MAPAARYVDSGSPTQHPEPQTHRYRPPDSPRTTTSMADLHIPAKSLSLFYTGRVRFWTTGREDGTCPNIENDCTRYIIHTAHAAACRTRHRSHQTARLTRPASSAHARLGEETGSVRRHGRRRHAYRADHTDHGDHPDVTAAVNPPTTVITRPLLVGASRSSPPSDGVSPTGL